MIKKYSYFIKESLDDLPDEYQDISDILVYLLDVYSDTEVTFYKNTVHLWMDFDHIYHGTIDDYLSDNDKKTKLLKDVKACSTKIESKGYDVRLRISDRTLLELLIFKKQSEDKYFIVSDKNVVFVNWSALERDYNSSICISESTLRFDLYKNQYSSTDSIVIDFENLEFNGEKLFLPPDPHRKFYTNPNKCYWVHGSDHQGWHVTFYFNPVFRINI